MSTEIVGPHNVAVSPMFHLSQSFSVHTFYDKSPYHTKSYQLNFSTTTTQLSTSDNKSTA